MSNEKMRVRPTSQLKQSLLVKGDSITDFSLQMDTETAEHLALCWNSYESNQKLIKDLVETLKSIEDYLSSSLGMTDETTNILNKTRTALAAARENKKE